MNNVEGLGNVVVSGTKESRLWCVCCLMSSKFLGNDADTYRQISRPSPLREMVNIRALSMLETSTTSSNSIRRRSNAFDEADGRLNDD